MSSTSPARPRRRRSTVPTSAALSDSREPAQVPGHRGLHPQPSAVRGRGRAVGEQERDHRVDLPRVQGRSQLGDEPRPGDRGTRVEDVVARLGHRRRSARRRSSSGRPRRVDARSPAARPSPGRGDQSADSLRPPSSATNSSSQPAGTRSWSMPGAALTATGSRPAEVDAPGEGRRAVGQPVAVAAAGRVDEGRLDAGRGRPPRRRPARSRRAPPSPSAAALCCASRRCVGSRSTARTCGTAAASASRSPPMPQQRSATLVYGAKRTARWAATAAVDACSSPARVNSIASASANLASARARSSCWVSAAATRSAGNVRRRVSPAFIESPRGGRGREHRRTVRPEEQLDRGRLGRAG